MVRLKDGKEVEAVTILVIEMRASRNSMSLVKEFK